MSHMNIGAQLPNVPPQWCIYHLLEEQARRTPNALAFAAPGRPPLFYGRLRHYLDDGVELLWAMGVDRHDRIALVLPNGPEMALAFLTISAVATCTPLNPAYRTDEFDFFLTNLPAKALMIQADMDSPARDVAKRRAIPLIELVPVPEAEAGRFLLTGEVGVRTTPPRLAQPDDVALGLYTSGTISRPKLVPLTHINLCTSARNHIEALALGAHDCCLNVMPLFHAHGLVTVILTSMLAGASVVCPPDFSAPQFFRWMDEFHPTWYTAAPSIHQVILAHAAPNREIIARCPLRFIRSAAAPLLPQTMEELEHAFRVPVIQAYGMTEAAAQITSNPLPPYVRKVGSVGVAAGPEVAIMNEAGDLLDAREIGEIVIRGPSVMQGYDDNPTANSQSFTGGWFRTGDQGFLDPDGYLFITGRLKEMINRGGEKITPREVEDVLMEHPAVAQAVTFGVPDARLGEDIAAAVVLHQNASTTERDIRQFAALHLAHFKVPRRVLIVDDLPRGPTGKLQRLGLAEKLGLMVPDRAGATMRAGFTAPRTPVEEMLAGLWAQVLHLERVGIYDDFFLLGGDSLLATQLLSRVRETMHVELSFLSFLETPTVAGLAVAIARCRVPQLEHRDTVSSLPMIVPAPDQRFLPFPLTDVQEAYWIGCSGLFQLGNVSSHLYMELDCVRVDLERLNLAWQQLIERHDMLRAIVLPEGQQQILERVPPYQIAVLDLRGQAPQAVTSQLEALRERMSHQVLPSDRWPLFEIRATRLDDQLLRLHFSFDALILDASSRFILFSEWSHLYENCDTPLAPLELSFRDYVLAEIALRDSDLYRRSQGYWWNRLTTLPPAPELPLAKNPSLVTQPRFVCWSARLEPEAWLRLKNRASQTGLTPSAVLLAAFAEVLKVWSKNPRFTLNLTYFHRPPMHPQVNDIVGDCTSLILLALDNAAQPTFEARARRLQEQLWDDLDHRYVSGVQVIRELAKRQGEMPRAAMPVVFTSTLPHQSQASDPRPMAWLGDVVYRISQTPQVWLDHVVYEEAGALVYNWNAVEELFPEGLLDDMFDSYCHLLQRLADEEESWQESWPETARKLIPPAQLGQRAVANATEASVPAGLLHTLFAEQIRQRPLQPAVVSLRRTLTYEELSRRSTQVGHWLRQQGARPNTLVAVVMEKGWEQVVAVLGILQSGAAYLPIDAELPKERLWYLLEQGEVELALTQSWLDENLEWPESVERRCVDKADLLGLDAHPLEPVQGPEDLAYVIYTSGSSGLPKGVMIDHRGAVNTIVDINQRFGVGPEDRVLALSSLSFDLSVYDIFGTLAAGGTIIIPDASATRDPGHWAELMVREQVTVWNSVPALMEMLVEYAAGRPEVLPHSLRLVLLSGDWIPVTLPDRIKALVEGVQVISLGGATEASIWSILYPIETVDAAWKSIPYGKPMLNQRFHVLNEALEPCPVWVPGQLHIGGIGLAKGYWRDEEKTCGSFIIHPWTGERLYRTGDLGRYLPDGNIEFLGREDLQVKIQGYRIELGEIEAALTQHPAVRIAVVTAVGEQRGNKRLVAYVVPNQEQTLSVNGLQSSLNEKLIEDFELQQREGVLLDPRKRLEFKLRQPGLREESDQPSVRLIKPELDETLIQTYAERRSYRAFLHQAIPFEQFSEFLGCLYQIKFDGLPKYRYASAGGLYPVQTYLYIKQGRVEGLSVGTYYYHPTDHSLLLLSANAHIDRSIHAPINQPIFDESAFSIFLIGQLSAIAPMYGEWARDFCMLEAGYMSQHLMNSAPASQIGLCPVGSLDFEQIRDLFVLEESHVFLHSLLGGRVYNTHQAIRPLSVQASSLKLSTHPPHVQRSKIDGALVRELRNFLKEKLPEYMVPSAFMVLDAMPLTPNSKVDRKALPEPESLRRELEAVYVVPRTEVERTIAAIWQEVLHAEQVSAHHNFFDLGGNSLHVVQVHNKLREVFHRDISVTEMFNYPTISSLAKYLSEGQSEQPSLQESQSRGRSRRELMQRGKQSRYTHTEAKKPGENL